MPISSFFSSLGNQARRFAGQAYGALDRSVGGVLPGGADSPFVGKSRQYFERPDPASVSKRIPLGVPFSPTVFSSPFEKDLGRTIDAAASAVANVQPLVRGALSSQNTPAFLRNTTSSLLNQTPVSVNLFGRYYTGLGAEGLNLPQSFIEDARNVVQESAKNIDVTKHILGSEQARAERDIARIRQSGNLGHNYKSANDFLAEVKSLRGKVDQGYVPVETAFSSKDLNPLTSLGTSLGRALFKPTGDGGWKAKEVYDFAYAGANKSTTPKQNELSTSQEFSQAAASTLLDRFAKTKIPGMGQASASPAALFGRAVVSRLDPYSFEYAINIPPQ